MGGRERDARKRRHLKRFSAWVGLLHPWTWQPLSSTWKGPSEEGIEPNPSEQTEASWVGKIHGPHLWTRWTNGRHAACMGGGEVFLDSAFPGGHAHLSGTGCSTALLLKTSGFALPLPTMEGKSYQSLAITVFTNATLVRFHFTERAFETALSAAKCCWNPTGRTHHSRCKSVTTVASVPNLGDWVPSSFPLEGQESCRAF